jgi:ABC-type sugar transport system ATPase subunit
MGLCDRIAVMQGGTVVAVLERGAVTREEILALALGHGVAGALHSA